MIAAGVVCAGSGRWLATSLSVTLYPSVMATTKSAPERTGGAGTGRSNQRQAAPINIATIIANTSFMVVTLWPNQVCVLMLINAE